MATAILEKWKKLREEKLHIWALGIFVLAILGYICKSLCDNFFQDYIWPWLQKQVGMSPTSQPPIWLHDALSIFVCFGIVFVFAVVCLFSKTVNTISRGPKGKKPMTLLIVASIGAVTFVVIWLCVPKFEKEQKVLRENNDISSDMPIAKEGGADVALRFINPDFPALELVNQSDTVAKEIKYTVVLWNRDLPDRNDPLPIPVATFDFIRGRQTGGPQGIFEPVASLLKAGNHLMGTASVISPDGLRGHTYVVSIIWGQGGWYSEVTEEKEGHLILPTNFLKDTREKYFQLIEAVPTQARISISMPP